MPYDIDYVEYDEFGMVRVRCMRCGTPVMERTYTDMPSFQDPTKKEKVMAFRRLSNHTELAVRLSDGSMTGLPHCTTCADLPIDKEKVSTIRTRGARIALNSSGKDQPTIEAIMEPQEKVMVVMKEDEFQKACLDAPPKEIIKMASKLVRGKSNEEVV